MFMCKLGYFKDKDIFFENNTENNSKRCLTLGKHHLDQIKKFLFKDWNILNVLGLSFTSENSLQCAENYIQFRIFNVYIKDKKIVIV